jgi:hypothetical protein
MSLSFISGAVPGRDEAGEPDERLVENGGVERVMDELSAFFGNDEVGLAQQIEVIGNAGEAHDKVPADFAHAQFPLPEELEDAAAGGVVEGAEKLGHDI